VLVVDGGPCGCNRSVSVQKEDAKSALALTVTSDGRQ